MKTFFTLVLVMAVMYLAGMGLGHLIKYSYDVTKPERKHFILACISPGNPPVVISDIEEFSRTEDGTLRFANRSKSAEGLYTPRQGELCFFNPQPTEPVPPAEPEAQSSVPPASATPDRLPHTCSKGYLDGCPRVDAYEGRTLPNEELTMDEQTLDAFRALDKLNNHE